MKNRVELGSKRTCQKVMLEEPEEEEEQGCG